MKKRKEFVKNPEKLDSFSSYLVNMLVGREITSKQYIQSIEIAQLLNRYPSWFEDLYKNKI